MDKYANGVRVDLLLILDDGEEDLRTGGVLPKVFFDSILELDRDGREHILPDPSNISAVEVADRETIFFSVPNPFSCQGLDPLGYFSSLATNQSSRR